MSGTAKAGVSELQLARASLSSNLSVELPPADGPLASGPGSGGPRSGRRGSNDAHNTAQQMMTAMLADGHIDSPLAVEGAAEEAQQGGGERKKALGIVTEEKEHTSNPTPTSALWADRLDLAVPHPLGLGGGSVHGKVPPRRWQQDQQARGFRSALLLRLDRPADCRPRCQHCGQARGADAPVHDLRRRTLLGAVPRTRRLAAARKRGAAQKSHKSRRGNGAGTRTAADDSGAPDCARPG